MRRGDVGIIFLVGAVVIAAVSPAVGGSACGAAEVIAALLPIPAAGLAGVGVSFLLHGTRRRIVIAVVAFVVLVVLLGDELLFLASAIDSHACS